MFPCAFFSFAALCAICNGQSIPIIANANGGLSGPELSGSSGGGGIRFPGPQYFPASAQRPPSTPQTGSPLISILGNLLGGLGSLALNVPPPASQQPINYAPGLPFPPPQRFPQNGRLVQGWLPEPAVECSATPTPQFLPRPGSHQSGPEFANDASNKTGVCVPSPMDCGRRGGSLLGPCLRFRAPNAPPQIFGACCYFETTCGGNVFMNGTHFRSPNFPDPYPSPGSCQVTVKNTYSNICQIRLDFLVFNLKQPVLGNCNSDRFVVNGQANNDIIPSICGYNPDQHMYVEVDDESRKQFSPTSPSNLITLNIITSGNRNRWFDIKVSYISCDSPYRAPKHCLQYFYELIGQVRSFNYDLFNQGFTYFNNLDYTICFRKWTGFCTVSYSIPADDESEDSGNEELFPERNEVAAMSQVKKPEKKLSKRRLNDRQRRPQEVRPPHEVTSFQVVSYQANPQYAAAGPLKCATDYLLLNGLRFCGSHLNEAALYRNNINSDVAVVDNSTGPVSARFVTSVDAVGKGFLLDYQLNPCLLNG